MENTLVKNARGKDKVIIEGKDGPIEIAEAKEEYKKQAYYNLRSNRYEDFFNLDTYDSVKDQYDDSSTIYVAEQGMKIIGGCRMTGNVANPKLPFENYDDNFNVRTIFGDDVADKKCVELSRLVVGDNTSLEVAKNLILNSYYDYQSRGYKYGFFIASSMQTKLYLRILRNENINTETNFEYSIPFPKACKAMIGKPAYLTLIYG